MRFKKYLLITIALLLVSSREDSAQILQVGAGGVYGFKNTTVENGMGFQFYLIYRAQRRIAILSTVGHYKEPSPEWNSIYSDPYLFGYLNRDESFLLPGDFSLTWFELSPNLGYNIRGAFNISVNPKSQFSLEAKYVFYKPKIHYEINMSNLPDTYYGDRTINLNTFFINFSLMIIL